MKSRFFPLCLLLLAFAFGWSPSRARAQDVSFDFFYDNLQPYGDWIQVADYGLCWRPTHVDPAWSPYTDGYWAYTDAGWTWVSYEDYGSIVYHYGRWVNLADEGWTWVPGYDWGPAWVSWRSSDDFVGWAPLPPEVRFRRDIGVSFWVDTSYDIGPGCYHFCGVADFGAPVISAVLLPPARNVVIISNTVNITNITVNNYGVPFCGGPRFEVISAHVRRPIPTLKLVQETNINKIIINRGGHGAVVQAVQRGNTLVLPAPALRPVTNPAALSAKYKPARVVTTKTVKTGWEAAAPGDRERLRQKFTQDIKGATPATAPARPVQPAEISAVPQRADPKAVPAAGARPRKPGTTTAETVPTTPITPAALPGAPAAPGGFIPSGRNAVDITSPKAPAVSGGPSIPATPSAPTAPAVPAPGRKNHSQPVLPLAPTPAPRQPAAEREPTVPAERTTSPERKISPSPVERPIVPETKPFVPEGRPVTVPKHETVIPGESRVQPHNPGNPTLERSTPHGSNSNSSSSDSRKDKNKDRDSR